jgi:hypothetical protein
MRAEGSVDRLNADRLLARQRGVVVAGAARPDYLSVSGYFRSLDWRVIGVEPNPKFCELRVAADRLPAPAFCVPLRLAALALASLRRARPKRSHSISPSFRP